MGRRCVRDALSALMRQVQRTQVLQEARVPAQALNAATHERVKQGGVEMTPASDVSAHHGQGSPVRRLQHTCDPTNAGSEQEVRWGGVASRTHRRVTERCGLAKGLDPEDWRTQ